MALVRCLLLLFLIWELDARQTIKIGFTDSSLQPNSQAFVRLKNRLKVINENATLQNFGFVPAISAAGSGCSDLKPSISCSENYRLIIDREDFDAVVGSCSFPLMEATKSLSIPYFVVSTGGTCDSFVTWTKNVFWVNTDDEFKARALKAIFDSFRITKVIAITDYVGEKYGYYHLLADYFYVVGALKANSSDAEYRQVILDSGRYMATVSTKFTFVVLISDSHKGEMIQKLLKEALLTGYLKTGQKWFLPTFTGSISDLANFAAADGIIYTFKVSRSASTHSGLITATQTTEAVVEFIIDAFGNYDKEKKPSLDVLRKSKAITSLGATSFNTTTGRILNDTVQISNIQDRHINTLMYLYENGAIKLAKKDHTDPTTWKVALLKNSVYYNKTISGSHTGFSYDLLTAFGKENTELYITYVFPDAYNLTSDTNGLLKLLENKQADIALVAIPVDPELTSVNFFNPSFGEEGYNMLMMRQNQTWFPRMVWYITVPFTLNVWIGLAFSYLLLVFVLWATDKISPNHGGQAMFGPLDCFFLIAAAFMMAKLDVCPRMMSVRIFNLLLWFATLIMVASYAAALFPYILNKPAFKPVTSLQTAYEDGTFKWFFSESALKQYETLGNRTPGSLHDKFVKRAQASWPNKMTVAQLSNESKPDIANYLAQNPKYISVGDSTTHRLLMHRHCQLQVVGQTQVMKTTSFPYRKDWSGITIFSDLYSRMSRSTILTQLQDAYFNFNPCSSSQATNSEIRPMDLFDVMGIFLLLGGGIVFAFIVGFIELAVRKCNLSCQRCTGGMLSFGKTYATKVDMVTPDGVWVRLIGHGKRRYFVTCAELSPGREQTVSPIDQGLKVGSKLHLRYNGNNPTSGERMFKSCS